MVGAAQRDRLQRGRRIDRGAGHEHAAVDDVEVVDVVRPAAVVDDRTARIVAHAGGAHEMPARGAELRRRLHRMGAGRGQHRLGLPAGMRHHAGRVPGQAIGDFRRGDAVGIGQRGRKLDAVVRLGQVLAQRDHGGRVAEAQGEVGMMALAPGDRRHGEAHRRARRAGAAVHLEGVAAHEAARAVGLVELLRQQDVAERATIRRIAAVGEEAGDGGARMEHQVAADQSARIGEPVGMALALGQQHQARRADAVGGQHHQARRLELDAAVGIKVAAPVASVVTSKPVRSLTPSASATGQ